MSTPDGVVSSVPPAPTVRSGSLAPGVAFVTGGARGLGNAIAVSFAREGARGVVLVDIHDLESTTFKEGRANVEALGTKVRDITARKQSAMSLY